MKPDEANFRRLLAESAESGAMPKDLADSLGIHPKRAEWLYEKWASKGWYEWGVSARTGWLTPEGLKAFRGGLKPEVKPP